MEIPGLNPTVDLYNFFFPKNFLQYTVRWWPVLPVTREYCLETRQYTEKSSEHQWSQLLTRLKKWSPQPQSVVTLEYPQIRLYPWRSGKSISSKNSVRYKKN